MRSEKIKTPLTKPATPVSKRSGQMKAVTPGDGDGVAAVEQWDSQRAIAIPELADADVQLVEDEAADPQAADPDSAPTADV